MMMRKILTIGVHVCATVTIVATSSLNVAWAGEQSWVELAVHNIGEPINTMWTEGELSFAADGTMVYCSAREDLAVAPGDPRDLYIATFNPDTGAWNTPVNMGIPVNAAPATDVDPLRLGDDREPWITADGNTIYFKSDRLATTDPRNNNDLYVTHKVNGEWTTPELFPLPSAPTPATSIARPYFRMVEPCASRPCGTGAMAGRTSGAHGKMPTAAGRIL